LSIAAVGFRAKTGRAIAVVLEGDARASQFVWRGEVGLVDPKNPATGEPYHVVMELPWNEAQIAVQKFVTAIEGVAESVLAELMAKRNIRAVGVVGSPPRSLDRIGNPHIRAHAAEGILFRRVLEVAAARLELPCVAFSDRELIAPPLKELARVAGPPWRADERLAATAAWLAIGRGR
jgi:hypothetical protein